MLSCFTHINNVVVVVVVVVVVINYLRWWTRDTHKLQLGRSSLIRLTNSLVNPTDVSSWIRPYLDVHHCGTWVLFMNVVRIISSQSITSHLPPFVGNKPDCKTHGSWAEGLLHQSLETRRRNPAIGTWQILQAAIMCFPLPFVASYIPYIIYICIFNVCIYINVCAYIDICMSIYIYVYVYM